VLKRTRIRDFLVEFKRIMAKGRGLDILNRRENIDTLAKMGLTKKNLIEEIMTLSVENYCQGPEPDRDKPGGRNMPRKPSLVGGVKGHNMKENTLPGSPSLRAGGFIYGYLVSRSARRRFTSNSKSLRLAGRRLQNVYLFMPQTSRFVIPTGGKKGGMENERHLPKLRKRD